MKKVSIVLLLLFLLGCVGFTDKNSVSSAKPILPKEKPINTRSIKSKDFLINNKAVLGLKYLDIIKIWGKPKAIKKVKVYFPATVEASYSYILRYDNIDIEMYPEFDKNFPIDKTTSFRFDITGKKFDFYGVKVGMNLKKYLSRVKNKDVFSVKDILMDSNSDKVPYQYRTLLTQVKEKNYYINYDKAVYEQVVINDMPYGAVMLFKDNILERIVYGFPNAG